MKNAGKHADELKSLLKRLVKEYKPGEREPQEPLKALVRGAMSFDMPDSRADEAMRAIDREFVDLNELRVATDLEIQELLGVKYPDIERRVAMITPHAWANRAMAELVRRDGTLGDVLPEVTVLAGFAVVVLSAATVLLRRNLTR